MAKRQRRIARGDPPLGVYIHVPFCESKCGYCDFYSVYPRPNLKAAFMAAALQEMESMAPTFRGRKVSSVYLGGGTPTALSPRELESLLLGVRSYFGLAKGAEVSLECNPASASLEDLKRIKEAGYNRISIGVQSFSDDILKGLERIHTASEAKSAVGQAREAGFRSVGIDLIFGCPGQDLDAWRQDLDIACRLQPDHISAYGLTIEEGTPFHSQVSAGRLSLPDADAQADMMETAMDRLTDAGYVHYEISNYCLQGHECRHNLLYWKGGEYIGIGPAAHSYVSGERRGNVADLLGYCEAIRTHGSAIRFREALSGRKAAGEALMLRLRLMEGADLEEESARAGLNLSLEFKAEFDRCARLGLLEIEDGRAKLTRKGILLSNEVFSLLV